MLILVWMAIPIAAIYAGEQFLLSHETQVWPVFIELPVGVGFALLVVAIGLFASWGMIELMEFVIRKVWWLMLKKELPDPELIPILIQPGYDKKQMRDFEKSFKELP